MIFPRIVPLVALLSLLFVAGCRRGETSVAADSGAAVPVRTASVERVVISRPVVVPGTVRAVDRATIAAKISGSVIEAPWGLGQHVEAGAVLVKLFAPEHAAQVARARTQLTQSERELARDESLSRQGAGTDDAVRAGRERVDAARAALAEAEAMLAYSEIRAPFAGRITAKQIYPGDLAVPGQPLLSLEGDTRFEVEAALPESLAAALKVGTPVSVELPSGRVDAPVAEIAAGADVASRTVMAKLRLPANVAVSPGQFVRVWLDGPATPVLRVPTAAVTRIGQMERVFVVAEGRARLRLVQTGAREGDVVEINAGLAEGERVVLAPSTALRDGQPVEAQP